ncbi:DUF1801 domain-containing protein [Paenibacillus sp. strain BS8-2]
MNPEVTDFIEALPQPWQKELTLSLREAVHQAIPEAAERIQYKKPHFLKNGKYAAVISTSKDAVSFTIFNATGLTFPEGVYDGPPERKTVKLRQGDPVNSAEIISLLGQASSTL